MSQSKQKKPKQQKQQQQQQQQQNKNKKTKSPKLQLDELLEYLIFGGFRKSRANLSCDFLIFDPGPNTPNCNRKKPKQSQK